jgi:hypothetical protein
VRKQPEVIADIDWNFDGVPDGELVACCYWEYARESAFIRDTLRQYREWFLVGGKWGKHTGKLSANLEKIQCFGQPAGVFTRGGAAERAAEEAKSAKVKKPKTTREKNTDDMI